MSGAPAPDTKIHNGLSALSMLMYMVRDYERELRFFRFLVDFFFATRR
jgi:hypothetical protein